MTIIERRIIILHFKHSGFFFLVCSPIENRIPIKEINLCYDIFKNLYFLRWIDKISICRCIEIPILCISVGTLNTYSENWLLGSVNTHIPKSISMKSIVIFPFLAFLVLLFIVQMNFFDRPSIIQGLSCSIFDRIGILRMPVFFSTFLITWKYYKFYVQIYLKIFELYWPQRKYYDGLSSQNHFSYAMIYYYDTCKLNYFIL